jgi:hypothetical protein
MVGAPIRDSRGERLGVLCGRFTFEVHAFLVATSEERNVTASSYLIDERGRVLCSSAHHNEGVGLGEP